jgi:glycine/D-amino acid oxidase-like deaminating enzyme
MAASPRIIVVGAGIIGASIAWHLARAGASVTVIEAGQAGGVATRTSWAWINASHGNPDRYFRLRIRAMEEWRRLERDLPGLRVAWGGGLIWDLPDEALRAFAAEHAAWGYDIREVDRAQIRRLEPELAAPPDLALHAAGEGAVEPLAATLTLLRAAEGLGARLIVETPVRGLELRGDRVTGIETAAGRLAADEVILAAGTETPALAAFAGFQLPLTAPPGLLVSTAPAPRLLNGLVMAPALHLRQTTEGRLLAGADFGGSDPGTDPAAEAAAVFEGIRRMLRSGASLAFDFHTLGYRPTPADGFPAVGRLPGIAGLSLAVTHSGITLAPAIGRFLAGEILEGRRDPLLAAYGPERFLPAPDFPRKTAGARISSEP